MAVYYVLLYLDLLCFALLTVKYVYKINLQMSLIYVHSCL